MAVRRRFPLSYEVLAGNTADSTTLSDFLDRIERRGQARGRARREPGASDDPKGQRQDMDVFRSVPLLIQFVLLNSFKSIVGLDWSAFLVACLVLSIYTAAYCAEIVRSGILAVPKTTSRAARSLGMTYAQDLTVVVKLRAAKEPV